jgi:hypothetical protein
VLGRAINRDVACDNTYVKIRKWLSVCDAEHQSCHPLNLALKILPTLLLDVAPNNSQLDAVNLKYVGMEILSYAALSYCWGAKQPNATTSANIKSHLKQMSVATLPLSLQDAVLVTRKLGLRYLWIDSLCIIQDDEEAKTHEIGRMDQIYHNAYVTISASSAKSCDEGFLHLRTPPMVPIHVPFCTENCSVGTLEMIRRLSSEGPSIEEIGSHRPIDPIELRGWTLQESFMSRRMLVYSQFQLFWTCTKSWVSDGGRVQREEFFRPEFSLRVLKEPKVSDWYDLIEEYSQRQLSDTMDKMIAISSVAGYFARLMKDKYLAGHWASDLSNSLCWVVSGGSSIYSRCDLRTTQPSQWRAPSWSFMSVDGRVKILREGEIRFSATRFGNSPFLTVLDCSAAPSSSKAPFGQVQIQKSFITVKGRILEMPWNSSTFTSDFKQGIGKEYRTLVFDTCGIQNSVEHPIVLTNLEGLSQGQGNNLWLLMICQKSHHGELGMPAVEGGSGDTSPAVEWNPWGLILQRRPNGEYHRVGCFEGFSRSNRAFRKRKSETIRIV